GLGCFCDLHLAAFAKVTGKMLSREELVQRVYTGGRSPDRDAWLQVCGDSLRHLAARLRAAVDTVSPDIRLGHCAVLSTWDVDGVDSIELARIFAGKTSPFLRLIGAPYWAAQRAWGFRLASVIEVERMQRKWCEGQGIEIFAEGDVYPRPRFNVPAAYLEGFDTALRADGGLDGILKYMIDYSCSPHYETGYVNRHARNMPLYEEIETHFSSKPAVGVRVYEVMHKLQGATLPPTFPGGWYIQETFIPASIEFLCDNSVPVQYDTPDVTIVFGENARYASAETLQYGAILDAPAAEILTQRGFDVGLRKVLGKANVHAEYYPADGETVPVSGTYFNLEVDARARFVTHIKGEGASGGAYEYENADGVRFLVYPFHAYETRQHNRAFRCYCRMRQLAASIEYIRRKPMDVVCPGNPDLYIQCKKDERSLSIGLWNFSVDEIIAPKIRLCDEYESARFIRCAGELRGKEIELTTLPPFGFAAVILQTAAANPPVLHNHKGSRESSDVRGKEHSMMDVAPTVSAILGLPVPAQAKGTPIPEIVRDLSGLERISLVAVDALGLFAFNLWRGSMPFMSSLYDQSNVTLRSVMPSITPVNFATMVTGTDLAGHRVQTFNHNFACQTLFEVVRSAGGASAGVGFDGYTGGELLARFADICGKAGTGSDDLIVDKTIEIVAAHSPEFIIVQIGRVDDYFHQFGPSSPLAGPMLADTDRRLERLVTYLSAAGYGTMIFADHGQHDILDPDTGAPKGGSHGSDSDIDCQVPCTWTR
ncbi:MAG TPA: alkaline phosphatase family protein, partial [Candidatus Latescibacteria bacterium]|nr:alkaline phosphatase family protein [Candidatus Latescibacterota bacterium]